MSLFAQPWFLMAGLAVPAILWLFLYRYRKRQGAAVLPRAGILGKLGKSGLRRKLHYLPVVFKSLALVALAIALARPQSISKGQDVHSEGIDIVLVLDISASMLAQDFKPDRAQASKEVAKEFIDARPNDRIGVVLFAKQAFTQCPLTIDHDILRELVDQIEVGLADADNTAIGSALAAAINRLRASNSPSKVIILLTDGENNYGVPPTTTAEAAQALGVRIYTIGVGTRGTAPYPARDIFGRTVLQQVPVSIDENLLTSIAQGTGGKYFRATNENKLREIFAEIDRMEKIKVEIRAYRRYAELFYPWALAAIVLLILGFIASSYILRTLT